MNIWELEVREQIRDVVASYVQCADTGQFAAVAALFSEDGVLEIRGQSSHSGHQAIRTMFEQVAKDLSDASDMPRIRHHVTTHRIDRIEATTARSVCYWAAYLNQGVDHWGRYIDNFVVMDEKWLIARRQIVVDGMIPDGWSARRAQAIAGD